MRLSPEIILIILWLIMDICVAIWSDIDTKARIIERRN